VDSGSVTVVEERVVAGASTLATCSGAGARLAASGFSATVAASYFVATLRRNNPPKKLTRRSEIGALRLAAATRKNASPDFDHLISAGEESGRDREPELFCGLEVDQEISRFLNFRGAASRTIGEWDGCTTLRREHHDDGHAVLGSPRDRSPSSPPRGT